MMQTQRTAPGGTLIVIALLVWATVGVYSATLGLALDEDSATIVVAAEEMGEQRHYVRSRTVGFPFYEIPVGFFIRQAGVLGGNIYSMVFACAALVILWRLTEGVALRGVVFASVVISPLVLLNTSVVMETMQGLCMGLASVLFASRYVDQGKYRDLVLSSIFAYIAVLTRFDYAFLAAATFFAIFLSRGKKAAVPLVTAFGIAAVAAIATYLLLNEGLEHLSRSMLLHDPIPRRIIRAVVGYITLVTPLGCLVLAWTVLRRTKDFVSAVQSPGSWGFHRSLFVFALVFYSVRFATLPDEFEYIMPLFVLFLPFMGRVGMRRWELFTLCASVVLSGLIAVSFFLKEPGGQLKVSPAISRGAVFQGLELRQVNKIASSPKSIEHVRSEMARIAAKEGCVTYCTTFEAIIEGKRGLDAVFVRPSDLYRMDNPRYPHYPHRADFGKTIVLKLERVPDSLPWQLSQPFRPFGHEKKVLTEQAAISYRLDK